MVFEKESNNSKIIYNEILEIKLYNGEKEKYRLGGIILKQEEEDYYALISENLNGKNWKKCNRIGKLENFQEKLNFVLPEPIVLIYKKFKANKNK